MRVEGNERSQMTPYQDAVEIDEGLQSKVWVSRKKKKEIKKIEGVWKGKEGCGRGAVKNTKTTQQQGWKAELSSLSQIFVHS